MSFSKETVYQKIIRKSGMKPVSCKCQLCKSQCVAPCFGIPEDMVNIVNAGLAHRLAKRNINGTVIIAPLYDHVKKTCTFFTNGLCELHEAGLKPTVGKLSHHSTNTLYPKISNLVVKEWALIDEEKELPIVQEAMDKVKTFQK